MSKGDLGIFLESPIAAVLLSLAVLILVALAFQFF
jgi:hypothetical protein